jgi:hypothetical protein
MPLHDWTRVPAGLFHHFHQSWSIRIVDALNAGRLPGGTIALVEQRAGHYEPDVLAIESSSALTGMQDTNGGVAVLDPPSTRIVQRTNRAIYASRANRIVIRHHLGRVIAVIEIMSPGNKDSRTAMRKFVEKTIEFLLDGIHVLVVDPFPPTPRDPSGIHKLIWDEFNDEEPFSLPSTSHRVLVSYENSVDLAAYVETIAVGDSLPDMPIFLTGNRQPNLHAMVPLEATYLATWEATPKELRNVVETGIMPDPDAD